MTDTTEMFYIAFRIILNVFLLTHWMACIIWAVGITQYD